jgi:isopropylmalate/homocitrate/citramalate synthase
MKLRRYFRTEDYFVSPGNYAEEIIQEFSLPSSLEIHDCTLRDGEQQVGVAFSIADKVKIAEALAVAGIHRIEAGMPAVSSVDQQAVREIVNEKFGPKIFVFSRAMKKDIQLAADLGVDGVVIEVPSNDELIRFGYKWDQDRALSAALEATHFAHELGLYVDLFLMDSSRLRLNDYIDRVSAVKKDGWIDSFCLVDTQGVLSTPATRYYVKKSIKELKLPIEAHFHNDLGLSVANSLAAFESGASVIHSTVLGLGPRAGQTPTEQVALALRLLYGVDIGLNYKHMYKLAKLVADIAKVQYPVTQPVVGDSLYTLESGLPVSWWRNIKDEHPLALYGILPSLVDRPDIQIALGKSSGSASILFWLEKFNMRLANDDSIKDILIQVKDRAVEKGDLLNEEDFRKIVEPYLAGEAT